MVWIWHVAAWLTWFLYDCCKTERVVEISTEGSWSWALNGEQNFIFFAALAEGAAERLIIIAKFSWIYTVMFVNYSSFAL